METDILLLSIGRSPNTEGLDCGKAGVNLNPRGMIESNDTWQTSQPHIYTIGDCAKGTMLAHKAEEEAIACVEHIVNGGGSVNYDCIPSVIYTSPEVAWIGQTEEDLEKKGIAYKKGVFPMTANSRATMGLQDEGIIKILACAKTHKILGIWIIGVNAGEMLTEGTLAYS
jgi:dihydrolipoamide dehydrogenase